MKPKQTAKEAYMILAVRSIVVAAAFWCACAGAAVAQEDVIGRARAAAADGRRADGIALLEAHLQSTPRDVDARLVYGLILSWDGQYDRARAALTEVLAQTPDYLDARVALMNVEWWSGRTSQAREQVKAVLSKDAGNAQARLVQQRLDARTRPWSAGVSLTMDSFSDDLESWLETSVTIGRETPVGSLIVRGNQAGRFGLDDRQVDVEFYPTFRAGTYAFVGVGLGVDELLYPKHRISFDLYQSIGRGFEISGGYRQLNFSETTRIYLGTLTKYAGNWMLTGKAFVVPDDVAGDAWSYHAVARRYFGSSGTSFIGASYSHGFSREEPRGEGDLIRVDADTLRGQADIEVTERLRLSFGVSSSRQERASRDPLWQTTAGAGFTIRF
jgi:YaiO family outer membrane protein